MSLPFTTTTVLVETADDSTDKWESRTYSTVYEALAGIVSTVVPADVQSWAGSQQRIDAVLHCEPGSTLTRGDRVTDLSTSDAYLVAWVHERYEMGLGRVRAGLTLVDGISG